MGKQPAFFFYPGDWLRDTELQQASTSSRGIWINLICRMWDSKDRGVLNGTIKELSRLAGCSDSELAEFIIEAEKYGFCTVRSNAKMTDANAIITLENRRMLREERDRSLSRERQRRYAERRKTSRTDSRQPNAKLTLPSSSSSSKKLPKKEAITANAVQDLINSYHENCPSLPEVRKVSEARKRNIKARLREYPDDEFWTEYFQKVESSDFLSGRNGEWTGCGFDWLLKEGNLIKAIEGNYDNPKPTEEESPTDDFYKNLTEEDWEQRRIAIEQERNQ